MPQAFSNDPQLPPKRSQGRSTSSDAMFENFLQSQSYALLQIRHWYGTVTYLILDKFGAFNAVAIAVFSSNFQARC